MASNITLSAGVRQNLLALQNTAELLSQTQARLSTGKKVNSALDNPGSFFTSQSLSNRASDLNALLDSIGQAQKTLEAADQGITSLTKLVESAKSIAKQAQSAPTQAATTYAAISVTGNPLDETLASVDGATIAVANSTTYSFDIAINGGSAVTVVYTSDASALYSEIRDGLIADFATKINTAGYTAGTDIELVQGAGADDVAINALDADIDFVITNTSNSGIANNTYNSTSLLDNLGNTGYTLGVQVNGGANQVITFGTGLGEISTLAELNATIGTLSGLDAGSGASNSAITFNVASGTSQNSLTLTESNAAVHTALGIAVGDIGTTQGASTPGAADPTRTSLQSDYNNILAQIDTLAQDASYNGINLLYGDNLKVVFNEAGTSSQTITGVTYDSTGLGLSAAAGTYFQSNTNIDATIATLDTALTSLRTQASKFGSNLTTVQVRQEFTKSLVNTLQTGSDQLVLADTNEEGANLLALQTRQQLSTTSLSLAAQADQAVLRLF